MEITLLNCGTMRPRLAGLFAPHLKEVPCNCLLVDTGEALVLVDTGLGTKDMEDPTGRLGFSNIILNAQRNPGQPAVRQLERLGRRPEEVTHVIPTHLDRDHAGGLPDFTDASVHLLRAERDAALEPPTRGERERYRKCHIAHGPKWVTYETISGEPWFGMDCIRGLEELPPGIVLVPLPGHTRGHCGVAVDTGRGWLLHCGDAFYVRDEISDEPCPIDVRAFRWLAHQDFDLAMRQIENLRKLMREAAGEVALLATHDASGREALPPGMIGARS